MPLIAKITSFLFPSWTDFEWLLDAHFYPEVSQSWQTKATTLFKEKQLLLSFTMPSRSVKLLRFLSHSQLLHVAYICVATDPSHFLGVCTFPLCRLAHCSIPAQEFWSIPLIINEFPLFLVADHLFCIFFWEWTQISIRNVDQEAIGKIYGWLRQDIFKKGKNCYEKLVNVWRK